MTTSSQFPFVCAEASGGEGRVAQPFGFRASGIGSAPTGRLQRKAQPMYPPDGYVAKVAALDMSQPKQLW
jgi:hypothetical protein